MEVVLASGNAGKLRELSSRLGQSFSVRAQSDWDIQQPAETGQSFLENALLKARFAAEKTGLFAIADDSGLVVDCLQGAPGIYSARYAGEFATDQDNIDLLLATMEGVPTHQRGCAFHCAMVGFPPNPTDPPILIECFWRGRLRNEMSGSGGFGYDPVFQPEGMSCTSAELDPAEKNRVSHRGQAMTRLIERMLTAMA